VYDMYPWNDPDSGADHQQDHPAAAWLPAPRDGRRPVADVPAPEPRPAPEARVAPEPGEVPADPAGSAIRAVQVALDRRDNGGDALAAAGQPATQRTSGRTRQ
jgi:hypothetical protein